MVFDNPPPSAPAQAGSSQRINMRMLLKATVDKGASDLHVTTGTPPQLRIDGRLVPLRVPPLTPEDTKALCYSVLDDEQRTEFERDNELDLAFDAKNLSRFRANLFVQRGAVVGAFRPIPFAIQPLDQLGVPPQLSDMTRRPAGLILITGPTGAGKSTTLASVVDLINAERQGHVITIEDPIEFLHPNKSCVISQREIGSDTSSYKSALKYVLRQDPDVVLIGEMRDLDTVEATLSIAETGHLTFATLHTNSAAQTITRIIDVFPPHRQAQVRSQLSLVLLAVLSQQLVPKIGGGRVLATELMIANSGIRNLIREDKIHQIQTQIQVGRQKSAMHTMNQSLSKLVQSRQISADDAMMVTPDPEELKKMMQTS